MNFNKIFFSVPKTLKSVNHSASYRNLSSYKNLAMRFVQFKDGCKRGLGIQLDIDGPVVNLNEADSSIPFDMVSFLKSDYSLKNVQKILNEKKVVLELSQIELLPCITGPDKVVCVGLNYKGHCDEQNKPYPKEPFFFSKFPSTIIGPYDSVKHSSISKALDWEVEMAVVIGKKCRKIDVSKAYEYVFGYTVAQDISARDWQKTRNNGQWLIAKSMDTFCPLGSALVHKSEINDPHTLSINCSINGVLKQNGSTGDLIHRVDALVSFLSNLITLLPGDVILTGTPSGVGVFREPKEFLKVGDVIESEIVGIGKMINPVVDDD
ncbi:fumarylacetoacetate hydrolase domain-containing protein 2 [Daktulosphaira vitifoliae]|uniref:fumarylacetoacetate hydrolase domain-containing protein 2 n=1 Tax=Daktulosphaira vitifoliae TaxID=58002 RepID=UPI0021A9A542|nr:fumarylacetoacetate hydrolase domain-containing protein 2 [Daktulosphaira vitifoliae]